MVVLENLLKKKTKFIFRVEVGAIDTINYLNKNYDE